MGRKIAMVLAVGLFVFAMGKLSFAMSCGDHSGSQKTAQAHSGHEHGATAAVKEAAPQEAVENAGNKICPVSGEKIGQGGMEPVTYEYEGKVYNFCCHECTEEFKKDPQKYIKKVEEELQSEPKGESKHDEQEMGMMQDSGTAHQGHHH